DRDPRLRPLEHPPRRASAAPRTAAAGHAPTRAPACRRLQRCADRVQAGRVAAGLRERDSACAQQRHAREPPCRARPRRGSLLPRRRAALAAPPLRSELAPRRPDAGAAPAVPAAAGVCRRAVRSLPGAVKVLLVTMYFPPAGGGGVQRPLKMATHLP